MELEPGELEQSIRAMPDEELLKVVREEASQYRPEAIQFATAEISRRGLILFPSAEKQCGKCGSRLEEGFIPDYGHLQIVQPVTWVEGKPQNSIWVGTRIGDRRQLDVAAYRCTSCGCIEFYALENDD
jgi:Domain of unknown function (DUF6487)